MKKTGILNFISRNKLCTKAISMFLALVLIFYFIPTVIYAEIADALSDIEFSDASTVRTSDSEIIYEDISKREANVKHFRLSDGTYIAMQYSSLVHYINDEGSYEDIDNSLSEAAGSVYANPSSRIKFAKKTTGNGVLFTLKDGSTKLTLSLIGANKGIYGQITNYSDDENDTTLGKMSRLEKLTSKILYPGILDGVDLEYIAHSLSIKENIIVKEKKDSYSYSFELKLNGMTAELVSSGDIEITETGTGEIKYIIPAPIVYDAAYTYAPEGAAEYILSDGGNGKYTLAVNMSSEWMNDEDRVYPVTIDPTIGALKTTMYDTHITPADPTTGKYGTNPLRVATNYTMYFGFRSLPEIPAGSYISNASVGFTASTVTKPMKIAAYAATTSWLTGLTYNTHLNQGKGTLNENIIQDMQIVSTAGQIYRFDITNLMRGWYDGEGLYGFALKPLTNQGYTTSDYVEFYSLENGYDYPQLMISYQDVTGVEGYYSYSSHTAGLAGTGNINLATGSLNFTIPTLSTTDGLMPYTVSLVYNSEMAGLEYNSTYANVAYSTARTPLGMMLNIGETALAQTFKDKNGNSFGGIMITDADGTEHTLVYDIASESWYNDAGAPVDVTRTSTQVEYTDENNIKRVFTKVVSNTSWILSRIEDISGNAVVFTLDTAYRPTVVSLDPAGDVAAITMLELSYNTDGRLSMIYNPTTYEAAILRYSATYNGSVVTSGGKYLKSIDFARGDETTTDANWESYITSSSSMTNILHAGSASYAYNSAGYLISVSDDRKIHRLDYTLWKAKKYDSITEYAGTSALEGQSLHIAYGSDFTDVISNGNDEIYSTTDDITTRYIFDDYGRAISTYSFDSDGYAIYGAVTGKYSEEEGSKNNLEQKTVLGGISVNYLYNGGFESWSSTTAASGWTLSGAAARVDAYDTIVGGEYALALYPTANGAASASQTVTLDAGTYTLSFPYFTRLGANATATVDIESTADTSIEITEELNLNPTGTNGIESYFSTVFEVASDNTGISITVSATNGSSAQEQLYLEIYGIMLERGIGGSDMSLVNYGSFDASSSVALSSAWAASSSLTTVDGGTPFGNVLKINNNSTGTAYVSQRVFTAPESDLYDYDYEEFYGNGGSLVVSGFAKQTGAILSDAGSFAIKVNITYYQGTGNTDVVRTYILAFNPALDSWQFGSITINTEKDGTSPDETGENYVDYSCIRYIDILCDYSGQAAGYALFDNIAAMWDAYNTTSYKYDERGNLIEKGIGLDTEYYIYDSEDNLITYANGWGNVTKYTYSDNLPETVIEYKVTTSSLYTRDEFVNNTVALTEKNTTEYNYENGLLKSETMTRAGETTKAIKKSYTYDTAAGSINYGKLIAETDEMSGTEQRYSYNSQTGLLETSLTSANNSGSGVKYGYDSLGRLSYVLPVELSVADSIEELVLLGNLAGAVYTYNSKGLLTSISTATTNYIFTYDDYGNISIVAAGDNKLVRYFYNEHNGKIKELCYYNGLIERYVYNDLEMLEEIWYNKNGTESLAHEYEYNADGQLYKYTNHNIDKATVYKYNLDGQISDISEFNTVSGKHDFSREYFYEKNTGLLSYEMFELSYLSGSTEYTKAFDRSYAYNTDGSLKSSEFNSGSTARLKTTHWYDNYNRLTSKNYTFYANNRTSSFTGSEKYTYDSSGNNDSTRIKTYTVKMGSNSTVYTYTYDYRNYITDINVTGSEEYGIHYAYDELGQLIREDNEKLGKTFVYIYDDAGNITETRTYAYIIPSSAPNGTYTTESLAYTSSNWGDLLTAHNGVEITYDAMGNPLSYYGDRTFTWEGRELRTATTPAGWSVFAYNDNGTRALKYFNASIVTYYYYDGTRLISEKNQNETIIYIYDDAGAVIGMQYRLTTYAEDTWDVYWFERNLQGDIVAVYNTTGTKLISYTYDAWGNFTTTYYNNGASTTAIKNPFRYRGYYYDEDLALYYLQTRYYDSVTGRFISADDISYLGANGDLIGYNLYAYCSNNPVMGYDPYGTFDLWGFVKGVGRIVTGIAAVAAGVAVCVAGAPIAMIAVATVTIAAGVLTTANGAADIQQSASGDNFARDMVFGGNQTAYDIYSGVVDTIAIVGTAICGNYLSNTCTMKGAVPGTEGKVTLEPGTTLDRYGSQYGRYLTDSGTGINQLALPPGNSCNLTTYVVNRPLTVTTGIVAPCAWGPGGGVQYFTWMSVRRLVQFGFLIPLG